MTESIDEINYHLEEIKSYLLDLCLSLRVLSKRPDLDKEPIKIGD